MHDDEFQPVLHTRDLGPGQVASAAAHGQRILIANVAQTYFALEGECPADGTDLGAEGRLSGYLLTCPHDQRTFDVRTGQQEPAGAGAALQRLPLRVAENEILVGPPPEPHRRQETRTRGGGRGTAPKRTARKRSRSTP